MTTFNIQISLPIHYKSHWILIAISIPLKIIKICDSINANVKKDQLPPDCIIDVMRLLDYYYPQLRGEWTEESLHNDDRFQDPRLGQVDCGYHVLNFIEAACKNERIQPKGDAFTQYKYTVDAMIVEYRNKIIEETATISRNRTNIMS